MLKVIICVCLAIALLLLPQIGGAELLVADDFEGKLKNKYWKGQDESWKVKGGKLEIHRLAGMETARLILDTDSLSLRILDFALISTCLTMMIFRAKWSSCFAPT